MAIATGPTDVEIAAGGEPTGRVMPGKRLRAPLPATGRPFVSTGSHARAQSPYRREIVRIAYVRPSDFTRLAGHGCAQVRSSAMAAPTHAAGRQELTLVAEPVAVRRARAWLSAVASDLVDDARRADLELVMTEVVTNAVRHGVQSGALQLAATPKPEFLCVQVTDEGPGLVPRPGAMTSDEHGGFGLFIVERLTRRWGMTREHRRTRVWFEFDY